MPLEKEQKGEFGFASIANQFGSHDCSGNDCLAISERRAIQIHAR